MITLLVVAFLASWLAPWVLVFVSDTRLRLLLAPAVSLAGAMLVATAGMMVGWWAPRVHVLIMLAVCGLGLIVAVDKVSRPRIHLPQVKAWHFAPVTLGVVLWLSAVAVIDVDRAGALGLLQALPVTWYLAVIAAVVAVRYTPRLGLVLLALITTVTVNLADGGAVVGTTYVHIGIIESIIQRADLLDGVDARFSWPGFFLLVAFAAEVIGGSVPSIEALGSFALIYPALIVVAWLYPIHVLAHQLTGSRRAADIAAVVFIGLNWTQQDYFSPQSLAFFFYVTLLAVLISEPWPETPGGRLAVELGLVILLAAMVVGHQLTPVAAIIVLALLALFRRTRLRTLWATALVLFVGWFIVGASGWWSTNLGHLVGGIFQPAEALTQSVGQRVRGDDMHAAMQIYRIIITALLSLGALVGWFLARHQRPVFGAIGVAGPALLLIGQVYGGEILLRIFLYASPFIAAYVAYLIHRIRQDIVVAVVLILVVIAGTVARGVNISFERNPAEVVTTAREVLRVVPEGATVRPLRTEGSLQQARFSLVYHPDTVEGDGDAVERLLIQAPDMVFLTSTREHYERLVNGDAEVNFRESARRLEESGQYTVVYWGEHVIVAERLDNGTGVTR